MHLCSHNHIKLSKSPLTLRHPPPSVSPITTMHQRTPLPSPTSTDTTATSASTYTIASSCVNGHDPGKFFYFYFYTHNQCVRTQPIRRSPYATCPYAMHPHTQPIRVHNPASEVSIFIDASITDFSTPPSARM